MPFPSKVLYAVTEMVKYAFSMYFFQHAPLFTEVVGLRPGRPKVRLEMEKIGVSSNGEIPFTVRTHTHISARCC